MKVSFVPVDSHRAIFYFLHISNAGRNQTSHISASAVGHTPFSGLEPLPVFENYCDSLPIILLEVTTK